jgi:hypothetical protein
MGEVIILSSPSVPLPAFGRQAKAEGNFGNMPAIESFLAN